MPLNEEQIRQRRNMRDEVREEQDRMRIADALESVAETLSKIETHLSHIAAKPIAPAFQPRK